MNYKIKNTWYENLSDEITSELFVEVLNNTNGMKAQEIRDLSEKERQEKATDLGQEIFNLRFQLATGIIEIPSRLKSLRRDIARIKTIQKEVGDKLLQPALGKKEEKK